MTATKKTFRPTIRALFERNALPLFQGALNWLSKSSRPVPLSERQSVRLCVEALEDRIVLNPSWPSWDYGSAAGYSPPPNMTFNQGFSLANGVIGAFQGNPNAYNLGYPSATQESSILRDGYQAAQSMQNTMAYNQRSTDVFNLGQGLGSSWTPSGGALGGFNLNQLSGEGGFLGGNSSGGYGSYGSYGSYGGFNSYNPYSNVTYGSADADRALESLFGPPIGSFPM